MTDRERKVKQLRHLIKVAHEENYDFVYLPVGDAKTVVRLLEEQEIVLEGGVNHEPKTECRADQVP